MKNALQKLKKDIYELKSDIDQKIGARDTIAEDIKNCDISIEAFNKEKEDFDKILKLLQYLSDVKKDKIKFKMEKLITRGLSSVYNKEYQFELDFEIKRDSVYVYPNVVEFYDGKKLKTPILDARGGGISDIVSFLNRIVILSIYKPQLRKVLFLDEPFKWVSREYLYNIDDLLKMLNRSFNMQFIIITHKSELVEKADAVFKTLRVDGVTQLKKVK